MSIRARIAAIRSKIDDHKIEIKKLQLDIDRVRLDCQHRNKVNREIGYADERWVECADCGKEF